MSLEDLISVPEGSNESSNMYLVPLSPDTGDAISGFDPMRLQYWPETVTWDRGQLGWQFKQIPGLSHPIVSWLANGAPTVSFEMVFTSDTDPAFIPGDSNNFLYPSDRNVNINAALAWLAACTNPEYFQSEEAQRTTKPPPVIQLVAEYRPPAARGETLADELAVFVGAGVPAGGNNQADGSTLNSLSRGLTLSHYPGRDFYGVVTSLNFTYVKSFVSGAPRIARAAITLAEVIQIGDLILPHNRFRNQEIAKEYNLLDKAAAGFVRSEQNLLR